MEPYTIVRKITATFVSSLLLSIAMAWAVYTPLSEQRPGVIYWSFSGLAAVYLLYSAPVFLLGGVPYSLLVDAFFRRTRIVNKGATLSTLLHTGLYMFGGFLIFTVFLLVISEGRMDDLLELSGFNLYGMLGAVLFYFIDELLRKVPYPTREQVKPEMTIKYTICFIRRNDEILLLNRERAPWMGAWNGVGGKIEPGESPKESVLREIAEETGLVPRSVVFKGMVTWQVDDSYFGGMYAYLAEVEEELEFTTPRPTEEGLLDWKKIDWILHPDNKGVASNIPKYLPKPLGDSRRFEHFCTFRGGRMTDFESRELAEETEESRIFPRGVRA
ncbi:8-oxo-dGTP diphosphatase [Paenibacillus sp. P26]|nr:8-oxo-dGTP diphosphatase [Paenibacillus sp. P26]